MSRLREQHVAGAALRPRAIDHVAHPITLAAEWLLDNFYTVEEQIRGIKDELPVGQPAFSALPGR